MRKPINLSVYDWDLYASKPGANSVAIILNNSLNHLLENEILSKSDVYNKMIDVMMKYAEYGAADTEPRAQLCFVLDEIFG